MSRLYMLVNRMKHGYYKLPTFNFFLPQAMYMNSKFKNYSTKNYLHRGSVLQRQKSISACRHDVKTESDLKYEFEMAYPKLIENFFQNWFNDDSIEDTISWFQQVMNYNVLGGKKYRGMALVNAFNALNSGNVDASLQEKSYILGWCIEMLQAFFLINDDIMDQSETRRGKECWYKKDGVHLNAINDALMLESAIYKILQDNFVETSCYDQIVKEFRETTWKTVVGQCMDTKSSGSKPNWNLFTPERYATIVKYKTSWYTFCLPINLAFILSSVEGYQNKPNLDNQTFESFNNSEEELLIKIGHYYQVQDDFIDCFGDPHISGKLGTDIEDGKCTWLIVEALRIADPEMKKVLKEIYGSKKEEDVSIVKEIYKSIKIPEAFLEFEEKMCLEISAAIHHIFPDNDKRKSLFLDILEKLYHRKK